jgi:DNA modification methylase
MTKDQLITENYAIYNSDCMEIIKEMPDNSIDLSVYSPPFAGLYNYSSSERDFSNCESKELKQLLGDRTFSRIVEMVKGNTYNLNNIKDYRIYGI